MADGANVKKRPFLRKILYRVDFQLIPESIHEELFEFVVKEYSYLFDEWNDQREDYSFDLEFGKDIAPRVSNKATQKVFLFNKEKSDSCDGRALKISREFIYWEINLIYRSMNIEYYRFFANVVKFLFDKKVLKLKRVGLRKFNMFYILDKNLDNLDKIFEHDFCDKQGYPKAELDEFKEIQIYKLDSYKLNFTKEYSTGVLKNEGLSINDEIGHLISFDFDLYSQDTNCFDDFYKDLQNELLKMNNSIYECFASTIKKEINVKIDEIDFYKEYSIILF